jgi:hypothetical protein
MEANMKTTILACAAILMAGPAMASACGDRIAELEKRFNAQSPAGESAEAAKPDLQGTAPESTGAMLHHQPTTGSVSNAEQSADSPQAVRAAKFQVMIEQARAANDSNDEKECEASANEAAKALR